MKTVAISGDASEDNIGITKVTFDRLLKEEKFVELIALYGFYCYTARWQKTNRVKCTDSFAATALRRSREHVQRMRSILESMNLVELEKAVDPETNRIEGYYIRVFHLARASVIVDHVQCDPEPYQALDHTNALITGSRNAQEQEGATPFVLISEPVKNGQPRPKDSLFQDLLPDHWLNHRVGFAWKGFVDMRRPKWPLTDRAVQMLVTKLRTWPEEKLVAALDQSTFNNWRDVYEPKDNPDQPAKPKPFIEDPDYHDFITEHPNEKIRCKFALFKDAHKDRELMGEFDRWKKRGKYDRED